MSGMRETAQNGQKTAIFGLFNFRKTVHAIRSKFCTVILHHIMALCVQFNQIRITRIRASQKEKDISRLLHRICGSGFILNWEFKSSLAVAMNS